MIGLVWGSFTAVVLIRSAVLPQDATVIRRDSSGVEIVETVVRGVAPTQLQADLVLERAGPSEGDAFFELRDGRLLPDGRVIVAEAHRVVEMDGRGKLISVVGSDGDGPGEFRSIRGIAIDDSIGALVVDSRTRRVTAIRDGQVRDSRRLAIAEARLPWDLHPIGKDRYVLGTGIGGLSYPRQRRDGRLRLPFHVYVIRADAGVEEALPLFEGVEVVMARSAIGLLAGEAPLARRGMVATLGGRVLISEGEGIEVMTASLRGAIEKIYRVRGIDLTIDRAAFDEMVDKRMGALAGAGTREVRQALLADLPGEVPGVTEMKVSQEGDIWLRAFTFPGRSERWHVLHGADGRFCGTVVMPNAFKLWDVGRGRFLGLWVNDLGEEFVRVYAARSVKSVCH